MQSTSSLSLNLFLFVQCRRARLYRWLEHKQPEWCRQRTTWSLYLFPPESRWSCIISCCICCVCHFALTAYSDWPFSWFCPILMCFGVRMSLRTSQSFHLELICAHTTVLALPLPIFTLGFIEYLSKIKSPVLHSASTLLIKHQSHILLLLLKYAQKDANSHHTAHSEADLIILCAEQHSLDACVWVYICS